MSTWEEDQERLRLAWMRFYVVAIYTAIAPSTGADQRVGKEGEAVSEAVKEHAHLATFEQDGLWHCASCPARWPRFVYESRQ